MNEELNVHKAAEAVLSETVVTVQTDPAPSIPAKAVPKGSRSMPKWESDTRDRVKAAVKKYQKPLADLIARDANEGDTRLLITDFLCDAFGYDKYEDLTTEYQVKGEFADYGVRIDKQLVSFIEVKRCAQTLSEKHLRQVQSYAVNEGVEWMILTNGRNWQVWHMTPGLPVIMVKALDIDLLGESTVAQKSDQMFYLTKEAWKRHQIDELWKARSATSAKSIGAIIMSAKVVDEIKKELRRNTGYIADSARILDVLKSEVLKPEAQ